MTEELFVAVPTDHHLARYEEIVIIQIMDESFVGIKPNCGLRDTLDIFFEKMGFTPKIKFEGDDVITVAGFVSAGLGVSILPAVSALQIDGISWLRLKEPRCTRNIGIAWSENHYMPPSTQLFKKFIIEKYLNQNS
ncbi:LysR substrate-binding domain-containing protein [Bacillus spizizenii]|nr:LysR substrate-binding domain-containing protein [Bacillus spizizenii]